MAGSADASADADATLAYLPAVVRVQAEIVRRGFWTKLRGLVAHAPYAEDALALWFCAFDRQTSRGAKTLVFAALAYFVLPSRFARTLPLQLLRSKFVDDAALLAAAVGALGRELRPEHRERARRTLDRLAGVKTWPS